jgi:hypothetical protein
MSILRARHPVIISAPYRFLRLLTLLRISEKYPQKVPRHVFETFEDLALRGAPLLSLADPPHGDLGADLRVLVSMNTSKQE